MYKVTLSMPVYNVEKYVERALLSALNQTFESIEFLIVDDKGNDTSMDIVQRIIADHPRGKDARIIDHGINQGTGATKNSAIEEAKGEYLYFMDSDDEITADCIWLLYDKMMDRPVDFVAGSYHNCDEFGKVIKSLILSDKYLHGEYILAQYYYYENNLFSITTWNKLYNIYFLREKNIKCIPYHLNEDVLFTFKIAIAAKSFSMISAVTYYYINNSESTMASQKKGINNRDADAFRDILDSMHLTIFNYQNLGRFGYLFRDEYILNLLSFTMRVLKSSMPFKDKYEYLKSYCTLINVNLFKYKTLRIKYNYICMILNLNSSVKYYIAFFVMIYNVRNFLFLTK